MELHTATRTRLFIGLENPNGEIHPEEVINFIQERVSAGTFYEGKGIWEGDTENSLVFEVMGLRDVASEKLESDLLDLGVDDRVEGLKILLEEEFLQDSVMIEQTEVEVAF